MPCSKSVRVKTGIQHFVLQHSQFDTQFTGSSNMAPKCAAPTEISVNP